MLKELLSFSLPLTLNLLVSVAAVLAFHSQVVHACFLSILDVN